MSVFSQFGFLTQTTPVVPGVDGVSDGSSTLPASIEKSTIGALFSEIRLSACDILLRNVIWLRREIFASQMLKGVFYFTSTKLIFHYRFCI